MVIGEPLGVKIVLKLPKQISKLSILARFDTLSNFDNLKNLIEYEKSVQFRKI